jgi:pyruvate/2-oxoglutarate/acetoin dehydrogenase E1 component
VGAVLNAPALKIVKASYFDQLCMAMHELSEYSNTVFMGQGVGNPGTTMSDTFKYVPAKQLLEMPVAEDMQMGMAIGMALEGKLPVCVFPRWNFLICAANQLVNHLDRLPLYSGYRPKVIIRTAVPSVYPFNPGPQHDDDFSRPFRDMLRTVRVIELHRADMIRPAYREAAESDKSTILVEYTDEYKNARSGR